MRFSLAFLLVLWAGSVSAAPAATQPGNDAAIQKLQAEVARLKAENERLRKALGGAQKPALLANAQRDAALEKYRAGELSRTQERLADKKRRMKDLMSGRNKPSDWDKAHDALQQSIAEDEAYAKALRAKIEPKVVPFFDVLAVGDVGDVEKVKFLHILSESSVLAELPICYASGTTRESVVIRGISTAGHVDDQDVNVDRTLKVVGTDNTIGRTVFLLEPLD